MLVPDVMSRVEIHVLGLEVQGFGGLHGLGCGFSVGWIPAESMYVCTSTRVGTQRFMIFFPWHLCS